jgi:D-sedoheptulose 7-phosphate isomerase
MKKSTMSHLERLLNRHPELSNIAEAITGAFNSISGCFINGNKLMVCGNGGSAADAEHIVGEMMKGYLLKRIIPREKCEAIKASCPDCAEYLCKHLQGALPAISLVSQVSLSTAIANDVHADMVFAQQVYGYGRKGDVLLAISTSGNASNVCNAVNVARGLGVFTIALTGKTGGTLKPICNLSICVPADETWRIQEYHQPVYHALCAMLEEEAFGAE